MLSQLTTYQAKLTTLFDIIRQKLDNKVDLQNLPLNTLRIVDEAFILQANTTKTYDLQTLLGDKLSEYETRSADISVLAFDDNVNSPMFGVYTNSESLISYGIKDDVNVIVANQSSTPLDIYVKIILHPIINP